MGVRVRHGCEVRCVRVKAGLEKDQRDMARSDAWFAWLCVCVVFRGWHPDPTAAHPQGDSALRYASRRIGQTSLKRSEVSIRNGVREGVPFDRC